MAGFDVREKGSGNAGTTNMLRSIGVKAAVITLLCDILKGVVVILIAILIGNIVDGLDDALLVQLAGIFVIIGHTFPIFFGFKGGKGIAVMAGLVFINSVWHMPQSLFLILVTALFFFIPVIVTRYISVGSLCAYTAFLIEMILFGQWGWFDMEAGNCYELYGIAVLLTALAWYRHRENIKRLVKGTENKFGSKRKGH